MKSELMVHNISDGHCQLIYQTTVHIEAPNWSPDGENLVFNSKGGLFAFSLADHQVKPIKTRGLCQLNNDHGISPDGTTFAISDKTETGESCIYTFKPGMKPVRITKEIPSYWHGWSPDGQMLAYTARRGGAFDIFEIAVSGGDETRLTSDMGHCDGPDYTPDGKYIWFNADKTGSAQLWRIERDGSSPEQMTDDERVNWFPHPSPSGDVVVYLSYPEGTLGHPADLEVELRVVSCEGGAPRKIVELFGGQGTINVPSWSPDGTKFAYVRYSLERTT